MHQKRFSGSCKSAELFVCMDIKFEMIGSSEDPKSQGSSDCVTSLERDSNWTNKSVQRRLDLALSKSGRGVRRLNAKVTSQRKSNEMEHSSHMFGIFDGCTNNISSAQHGANCSMQASYGVIIRREGVNFRGGSLRAGGLKRRRRVQLGSMRRLSSLMTILLLSKLRGATATDSRSPRLIQHQRYLQLDTFAPTATATLSPTVSPSKSPTALPSVSPSALPTKIPSTSPTTSPTEIPTSTPSAIPSTLPSNVPTITTKPSTSPTNLPTLNPTSNPSMKPSKTPTDLPTTTTSPTSKPSAMPSLWPSHSPTRPPSPIPSSIPSLTPSSEPSSEPSSQPSSQPTHEPTATQSPSDSPTQIPSTPPSQRPSVNPTALPTNVPTLTTKPSVLPTTTQSPSFIPSSLPTLLPSDIPSTRPTVLPSLNPTVSTRPSDIPSYSPSAKPSLSTLPTFIPSSLPSSSPSDEPSVRPSDYPSVKPSITTMPSVSPTAIPTSIPTITLQPSAQPSDFPSVAPTFIEEVKSTADYRQIIFVSTSSTVLSSNESEIFEQVMESFTPKMTENITGIDVDRIETICDLSNSESLTRRMLRSQSRRLQKVFLLTYSMTYTSKHVNVTGYDLVFQDFVNNNKDYVAVSLVERGLEVSSVDTTYIPANTPMPTSAPSIMPTSRPSNAPSLKPSMRPSDAPSGTPSEFPSLLPTDSPSGKPSAQPSITPTSIPSARPSYQPSGVPSISPSNLPSSVPSIRPSMVPSIAPSDGPTMRPSAIPSKSPTILPTEFPSSAPSISPRSNNQTTTIAAVTGSIAASALLLFMGVCFKRRRDRNEDDQDGGPGMEVEITNMPGRSNTVTGRLASSPLGRLIPPLRRLRSPRQPPVTSRTDNNLVLSGVATGTGRNPVADPVEEGSIDSDSLISTGSSRANESDSDIEYDETSNLADEFDKYKDQNLEKMRSEVEGMSSNFDGMMSQALTKALMDDMEEEEGIEDMSRDLPNSIEIEATVLCDMNDWLKQREHATAEERYDILSFHLFIHVRCH